MTTEALQTIEATPAGALTQLSVAAVQGRMQRIQEVMKAVMKDGEHFGVIPGTKKPTLYKSGAEVLSATFELAPRYKVERFDWAGGHREYVVTCKLHSTATGVYLGAGVGSCSTMESKYRWRRSCPECGEITIRRGHKDYGGGWFCDRKAGGCGSKFRDDDKRVERVENPDLADTYNTVLKMAKKRAHVDGVLTVTAASDMFTQDLEDAGQGQGGGAGEPTSDGPRPASGKDDTAEKHVEHVRKAEGIKKLIALDQVLKYEQHGRHGDGATIAKAELGAIFAAGKGTKAQPRHDGLAGWEKLDLDRLKDHLGLGSLHDWPARALPALLEFLSTVPPSILPDHQGEPGQAEDETQAEPAAAEPERWPEIWGKIRSAYEIVTEGGKYEALGHAAADLKIPGEWSREEVARLLTVELGLEKLEHLPRFLPDGKAFWPWVAKALRVFSPSDAPWPEDRAQVAAELAAPSQSEGGDGESASDSPEDKRPAMLPANWRELDPAAVREMLIVWHQLQKLSEPAPGPKARRSDIVDAVNRALAAGEVVEDTP